MISPPTAPLDRVFAALADPTRRGILARLARGEATVGELVTPSGLAQPTISKHLHVLEAAGLITRGRHAQTRPARLNPAPLQEAARWLGDYQHFWEASYDQLAEYVETLKTMENPMQTASTASPSDRLVTITRVFDAPARLVFLAHSAPEHIKRWFGPRDWPVTSCEMDFRVGGRFRFTMTGPDGVMGPPFGGQYLDIVPNRKIQYDNGFLRPGFELDDAEKMVTTITFDEADGKTTLTMRTVFGSDQMYNDHVGQGFIIGVNSGLDQLEEVVAELAGA